MRNGNALILQKKYFQTRIFYISLTMGIALGVLNAYLDTFIFFAGPGTFLDFLIFDVPLTESLARTLVLALFIVFGYLLSKKEEELRERNALLVSSLDHSPESIYWLNRDGEFYYINKSAATTLGYEVDEMKQFDSFVLHRHDNSYTKALWKERWDRAKKEGSTTYETTFITKMGDVIDVEVVADLIIHDEQEFYVAFARNISERKEREHKIGMLLEKMEEANEKLNLLANKDRLTGVFNRYKFDSFLQQYIMEFRRYSAMFSMMMCDIDHFKDVNDKYGHHAGDDILRRFVALLEKSIRESDIVARWGGEEFVVLLPKTELDAAMQVAQKIRTTVEENLNVETEKITVSIGVAEVGKNDTPESIFVRVDEALYRAKNSGRNKVCSAASNDC